MHPQDSTGVPTNSVAPVALHALSLYQQSLQQLFQQMVEIAVTKRLDCPEPQAQNFQHRLSFALSYFEPKLKEIFTWLFSSQETSNFTYPITSQSQLYLASMMSIVTGVKVERVDEYIRELSSDTHLKNHIRSLAHSGTVYMGIDPNFDFGRRLGWYITVRALKPRVVVETGVEQGLGSVVLAAALLRNQAEGAPGRYYGTDINPQAGYLFAGEYKTMGEILYGDSISSLRNLKGSVDVFINDSDHSSEYEWNEYLTIESKLSDRGVILADNAHVTDKLCQFARKTGKRYMFFQEKPATHWYPGAGIGIAF